MQAAGVGPDPAVMAAIERGNAVVFLDVALGEGDNSSDLGRIKLELFVKDVSETREQQYGDGLFDSSFALVILSMKLIIP